MIRLLGRRFNIRKHELAGKRPLRLAGFNIYVREGCYGCHSQMIRPFRWETERYGHYSVAEESMYDRPFMWGVGDERVIKCLTF